MPPEASAPHDLEAELYVLGAMLLASSAIDRVRETGLRHDDFYRDSHGTIFQAVCQMRDEDVPVQPVTLAHHLERSQQLDKVGGKAKLHEITASVPATSNAPHYAHIVLDLSRTRRINAAAFRIGEAALNGGIDQHPELLVELEAAVTSGARGTVAFLPMTHSDLMDEVLQPGSDFLIDDLIEPGIVCTIAGVPETFKSWLAAHIAISIAKGEGSVLDRDVTGQGPVWYVWEDDSTRNEISRAQLLANVHATPRELPMHWSLNDGIVLPRDNARIRQTIGELELVLVVLDSFYNVAGGVDLKDTQAGAIVSQLKREVTDPTGCTVLLVDHMAWANETNRQRLHAYGDVFKNAATRSGIYIDAIKKDLFVEARGNNIKGIPRTAARWNRDTLTLELVGEEPADSRVYDQRILACVAGAGDWVSTAQIQEAVKQAGGGGRHAPVANAIKRLGLEGQLKEATAVEAGKRGKGSYWGLPDAVPAHAHLFDDTAPDEEDG